MRAVDDAGFKKSCQRSSSFVVPVAASHVKITVLLCHIMDDNKFLNLEELNVQFEAARKHYEHILAKNPKDHMALYQKGLVHYNMRQIKDAITCFDRSIALNPNNHYAWVSKGDAILYLDSYKNVNKQYRDAIKCYDHALQLDPDVDTYHAKGNLLEALGEYENANECYDAVIKIDPNIAKIWELKCDVLTKLKRDREAKKCYKIATDIRIRYIAREDHD